MKETEAATGISNESFINLRLVKRLGDQSHLIHVCVCLSAVPVHTVLGSFRQHRDKNTQSRTELDGLMAAEREWKTAYIQKKERERDG